MPKCTLLTRKKTHKDSSYIGVYKKNNGWITQMTINHQKIVLGPFENEEDAARKYDEKVLEHLKEKAKLNILENSYPSKPIKVQKKKRANKCKIRAKKIHNRVKFSIITKNKICARQKWCCNFCNNLLSDIFIVDHVVPLFLGGCNAEYNLQALCPGCDRFKTSYLDYKVFKPLAEKKTLIIQDVFQAQCDNYHKMMCIDPTTMQNTENMNIKCNQYITHSNINGEIKNNDVSNRELSDGINLSGKELVLDINGIKIKIMV